MEKTLLIVRGLPGSGKTTAAEFLADGKWPVYSADDYFVNEKGEYIFDREKLHSAHKSCRTRTEISMAEGKEKIFVSNTFTQEKEIKEYVELAEEFGYRVISMIIENRHGNKSIHGVPEDTMIKMKTRFSIKL
jgi:dephospho-CoA kinase